MVFLSLITWPCVIIFIFVILRKFFNGPKTNLSTSLEGKIAIVTGASAGIGMETAFALLKSGAKVIFACRDETKTLNIINKIKDPKEREDAIFMKLDLSSVDSINKFNSDFRKNFNSFDYLVNNAGAAYDTFNKIGSIESTVMVNYLGPVILTSLLMDLIKPEGKIINLSSSMHAFFSQNQFDDIIKDLNFERKYNMIEYYSFSKLGNVMHSVILDKFINSNNMRIKTASVHPGVVASEFGNNNKSLFSKIFKYFRMVAKYLIMKDNIMGAQTTLHVIFMDYPKLSSSGYFSDCQEVHYSNLVKDENLSKLKQYTRILLDKTMTEIPKGLKILLDD